ncbi:MAG: S8 family serine peptidase [Verrucomicrobia bacterium]|nr:S8 family serine peptidase [Verrucomicrobiota bacterium]
MKARGDESSRPCPSVSVRVPPALPALPLLCALCVFVSFSSGAGAAEVQLRGDRAVIRADGEPLAAVLAEFQRAGVRVRLDPDIDRHVTVNLSNRDTDGAVRALIDPLGYALSWTVLPGPQGSIPRLDEIRVFAPGKAERAVPLKSRLPRLTLSRGADGKGPLHVDREVLLTLKEGVSTAEFLQYLARWNASLVDALPQWGVYRIRLPAGSDALAAATAMRRDAIVNGAEANYAARLPAGYSMVGSASSAAGAAASTADPSSPRVAVLDTGLSLPAGWTIALAGAYDATSPGGAAADPVGHGTQMSLLASGAVLPDGAAPGGASPVLAVRTFDGEGVTSNFDLMRAVGYAVDNGARVVSLSWGTETASGFVREAVREAQEKGLVVVAAAGNEATGRAQYPAAYPGVIGVAATVPSGQTWENSNYGDFIFVAAPGTATLPVGYNGPPGRYAGTSAATAYTAGLIAQWLAHNPNASAAQAADALKASLTDAGAPGRDPRYGYGTLDTTAVSKLLGR